jgi:beta-phosphoglucomutase-like phosphatase (HAD superfamily)
MSDSLIRRAMSLIAKRRMVKMSPEERQQIAGKGGKAWWDSLTAEEKRERVERLQKARRKKRAKKAKAKESKTALKPRAKSRKRT